MAMSALGFPASLTETYKPQTLDAVEWCGLERQRKILANLAAKPRVGVAVLLEGGPGVGKTSLAYAFARTIGAEVFHIGSPRGESCDAPRGDATLHVRSTFRRSSLLDY